jgi:hypothetical protein
MMAVSINFIAINVNAQQTNATVSIGENAQNVWSSHNKRNYGNGLYLGLAYSPNNLVILSDNDFIDMPVIDNDIAPSKTNQQV